MEQEIHFRPKLDPSNVLSRYPFCCDIPNKLWFKLSTSKKKTLRELSPTLTEQKRYIVQSLGMVQSCTAIQLSVYHQLDILYGHRDISMQEFYLPLVKDRCSLNKDIQVQHKVLSSNELKKLRQEILKLLLKIMRFYQVQGSNL